MTDIDKQLHERLQVIEERHRERVRKIDRDEKIMYAVLLGVIVVSLGGVGDGGVMTDIADRLRAVYDVLRNTPCHCVHSDVIGAPIVYHCERCKAMVAAPDPDAVGIALRRPQHLLSCTRMCGPEKPCDCGLDAALAKLEEKP